MADTRQAERTDDGPLGTSKDRHDERMDAENVGGQSGDALTVQSVTINKPATELYEFWRDLSNLPAFMDNVEQVESRESNLWHWVVKAPHKNVVEWDARIVSDEPGRLIAWESEPGSEIRNAGRITFQDLPGHGCYVSAAITYDPPGGKIGQLIAKLLQREPAVQSRRDLRRFKQLMETGEIATAVRSPAIAHAQREE